jgi:hypothetical protein
MLLTISSIEDDASSAAAACALAPFDTCIEAVEMDWLADYEGRRRGVPENCRSRANRLRADARAKTDDYGLVQGTCIPAGFDRPGTSTEANAFCLPMKTAGSKAGWTFQLKREF